MINPNTYYNKTMIIIILVIDLKISNNDHKYVPYVIEHVTYNNRSRLIYVIRHKIDNNKITIVIMLLMILKY